MGKIGLVLSGGMAKGAYQAGALCAINEYFSPTDFDYVSSASIGTLNTYTYLTNKLEMAVDIWRSVNPGHRRTGITSVLRSGFITDQIRNLVSTEKIENCFYVPLLNLRKRKLCYMDYSKVPAHNMEQYLKASVAIPVCNGGVDLDDGTYYDGAMVDNIPIYPVLQHKLDYIICIYFDNYNYIFENQQDDSRIIKITFPDNTIISNSITVSGDSITYMMEEGYRHTKEILDFIFSNGKDDLDFIYGQINKLNEMNANQKVRITGDLAVDNMNKVVRRFTRREIVTE